MSDFLSGRGGLLGVFSVETGRFLLENQVTQQQQQQQQKRRRRRRRRRFCCCFFVVQKRSQLLPSSFHVVLLHGSPGSCRRVCAWPSRPARNAHCILPNRHPPIFLLFFRFIFIFIHATHSLCIIMLCVRLHILHKSPPPPLFFPDNNNNPVAPFDDVAIWRPFSNFVGGFPGNASKKKPKVVGRSFFSRNVLMLHHIFFFSKKNKIKQNKNPTWLDVGPVQSCSFTPSCKCVWMYAPKRLTH